MMRYDASAIAADCTRDESDMRQLQARQHQETRFLARVERDAAIGRRYSRNVRRNCTNRQASWKLLAMPSEARTAPAAFGSIQRRKSS